ncbi:hypothetical protein F5148DRAFT_1155245 [Russula earlei]|uniref:Uncharacterized protein n=1 Tax=Russula earlei TaxID=71964 RepID=A0ACC0TQ34_9AGAM|nr:hypothetical protein F5148DRAFT_1155245 [Russula earlei]
MICTPIKYLPVIAMLLLLPLLTRGQMIEQKRVDSLLALLPHTAEDTNRVRVLGLLSFHYFAVDPDQGIRYAGQGLALAKKLGWKKGIALLYNSFGADYWAKSDYLKAQDYYLAALKINEDIGNWISVGRNLHNIADTYESLNNYPKALEYYEKAIKVYEEHNDPYAIKGCCENIAAVYEYQKNYSQALAWYTRAMQIAVVLGNPRDISFIYMSIGVDYRLQGNYGRALEYEQKAVSTFEKLGYQQDMAASLGNLADIYYDQHNYPQALVYYQKALAMFRVFKSKAATGHIGKYLGGLGKTYFFMAKDADNTTRTKYLDLSLYNLQKGIAVCQSVNDWVDLKDFFISLSDAYSLQGNYAASLDAYRKYAQYNDSLYSTEKDKEMTSREFSYEYERQKDSFDILTRLQASQLHTLQQEKELGKLQSKQQWLYTIIAIIVAFLVTSYFLFSNRIHRLRLKNELAKEKAEKQLKEAEYKSRMNDITLAALRSQMNPHFIFNCLNSIKLYTEQNNIEAASIYLTRFSKLIRSMLDNSRSESTTLTAEIELLQLYLEMEAMRFKEKLQYCIETDQGIDTDFIELPPLLIQPYVENAIWHGLMHKEEVADDGIGRTKSAALRSKLASKQQSYGTRLTGERITLINEQYQTGASVEVTDLTDTNDCACGTLVGPIGTYTSSVKALQDMELLKPDLLFLDVEMPVMNGFELLEKLMPLNAGVVFITAYNQYALKAFRFNALDYLVKPIDPGDLIEAVAKAEKNARLTPAQLTQMQRQMRDLNEIIYAEASNNYSRLVLMDGRNFIISKTLKDVQDVLEESHFLRVHRHILTVMSAY